MSQYLKTVKNKTLNFINKLLLFATIFLLGGYCFLILSRNHFTTLSNEMLGDTTYIMNSMILDIALRKPLILAPIISSILVIKNYRKQKDFYQKLRFNLINILFISLILGSIVYSLYIP